MRAECVTNLRAIKRNTHNTVLAALADVTVVGDVGQILKTINRLPLLGAEGVIGRVLRGISHGFQHKGL